MNISNVKNASTILLLIGSFPLMVTVPACSKAKITTATADTWKVYTYPEHGFSARFPSQPKKVESGPALCFVTPTLGETIIYGVAVSVGPEREKAKVIFDALAQSLGEKLKSQHEIELQGFPGREIVHEEDVEGKTSINTLRIYLANNRIYQVRVAARKGKEEMAETKKFQDSFKILDVSEP